MTLKSLIKESINIEDREKLAYAVGSILGDGGVYEYPQDNSNGYYLNFNSTDKEYALDVAACLTKSFGHDWDDENIDNNQFSITKKEMPNDNQQTQWSVQKGLAGYAYLFNDLINNYTASEIMEFFNGCEQELLRGLIDAEGSISKKGRITFYNKDERLIQMYTELIKNVFGKHLDHTPTEDMNEYRRNDDVIVVSLDVPLSRMYKTIIGSSLIRKRERMKSYI